MINELVVLQDNIAVTSSLAIAEGTENDHASVIKLVRTYQTDLEEFGLVRFQIRARLEGQHGGGDTEYALLNEQQASLLITYMRNNDIVRAFKKSLIKAFFEMKKQITDNVKPPTKADELSDASRIFECFHRIAVLIGLDKNQCALSANNAVKNTTNTDMLQLMGSTHLICERQEKIFTPTELGSQIGCSANVFNKKLEEAGLQTKISKQWLPTELGKEYSRLLDTGKKHSNGTPIIQIKWFPTTIDFLRDCELC